MSMIFAYVGCYTTPDRDGRGQGISVYQVDPASGSWTRGRLAAATANPSFLAVAPGGRHLYCVHGGDTFSQVSAFAIDRRTGDLRFLNAQPSGGRNPAHLAVDPTGRMLAVANYTEGTVAGLPLTPDGSLGPPTAINRLSGAPGPHPVEQTRAHPHHCPFDPAGHFVVVPDKGLDRLFIYRADPGRATLSPHDPPAVAARPGAGPRHVAFHPRASYAYVVNELDATIAVYGYDAEQGALQPGQLVSTLPPEATGANTGAEIAVAPSGRFLYASNRGHDSIAVFAIEPETGALDPVGWTTTGGRTPRFLTLDRPGHLLYVANQDSDTIVPFRVDPHDGTLTPTGEVITTGSPVCIVFVGA
ncbi:MAG TPA: lactonase family protein [Thermomicrobiales bacterium]|nr:lactonase family protein [Thermomicrobiales bacterium]